jgi:hypothetical protein
VIDPSWGDTPPSESHDFISCKMKSVGSVVSEVSSVPEFLLFEDQLHVAFFPPTVKDPSFSV